MRQATAWMMKHKLMHVMMERDRPKKLSEKVQVDDAYLGGRKKGKRGRGADGKSPFIAAVEIQKVKNVKTGEKREIPTRIKLTIVNSFSGADVEKWAKANLEPGCEVVSDGCRGFSGFKDAGFKRDEKIIGNPKKSENSKYIQWVNIVLGNLKTALKGTYKAHRRKYYQRYLSEFEYRFNRKYDLSTIFQRLMHVSVQTSPMPNKLLTFAEDSV